MLVHLEKLEAGDARDGHTWCRVKFHGHPFTQTPWLELDGMAADRDRQRRFQERVTGDEQVLRALDHALNPIAGCIDLNSDAALRETSPGRTGRIEQKCPLRTKQIRNRHRAQLGSVEPVRRKGHGNTKDRAPDAMLAENGPERL